MTSWVISIFLRSTPPFGSSREERHQRPERERVHDDPHVGLSAGRLRGREALADRRDGGRALLVVGGVHVDVQGLGARGFDARLHLLDVGQGGPEVEVDADDVVAGRGERQGRGLAHPGRSAQDQRPALAVVGHREGLLRRTVVVGVRSGPSLAGGRSRSRRFVCRGAGAAGRFGHRFGSFGKSTRVGRRPIVDGDERRQVCSCCCCRSSSSSSA